MHMLRLLGERDEDRRRDRTRLAIFDTLCLMLGLFMLWRYMNTANVESAVAAVGSLAVFLKQKGGIDP